MERRARKVRSCAESRKPRRKSLHTARLSSRLGIANRGRVIAAINRRRPLGRLSKLLSILKQNAFLRFIIVGVMTWSTLAPFLLRSRLLLFDHHLRLLHLSASPVVLPPPVIVQTTTTAMFRDLIVPRNTKRQRDIDLLTHISADVSAAERLGVQLGVGVSGTRDSRHVPLSRSCDQRDRELGRQPSRDI